MLSLCFTKMKTAMIAQVRTKPAGASNARRTKGIRAAPTSEPSDTYPQTKSTARKTRKGDEHRERLHCEKDAEGRGDAFAPLELEIDGEEVACEGGKAGGRDDACRLPGMHGEPRGDKPFQHIAEKRDDAEGLAGRPHHVRRPDVAAPDPSRVPAFRFCKEKTGRDRAEQIRKDYQTTADNHTFRPPDHAYRFLPLIVN